MDKKELRKEERFKVGCLPQSMKKYILHLNPELEVIADIVDASLSGLGLVAPAGIDFFIVGTNIAIYPIGKAYALYGKIVHTGSLGENTTRVGIALKPTQALEKYQEILKTCL